MLDLQFYPSNPSLLAVALSTGSIALYRAESDPALKPAFSLRHIHTFTPFPCTTLTTSLRWHSTLPLLGVTLSTGGVHLLKLSPDRYPQPSCTKPLSPQPDSTPTPIPSLILDEPLVQTHHPFEAWTVTLGPPRRTDLDIQDPTTLACPAYTVYSGGDDAVLRATAINWHGDLTPPERIEHEPVKKVHESGVTAILPLHLGDDQTRPRREEVLLTGSYDNRVRIVGIDATSRKRMVLAEVDLGGGVWKLRYMRGEEMETRRTRDEAAAGGLGETEERHVLVLASCMHAGAAVLDVVRIEEAGDDDEANIAYSSGPGCSSSGGQVSFRWEIRVLARFEEHTSMCYAAETQPLHPKVMPRKTSSEEKQEKLTGVYRCVSTSFYDRLLGVWDFTAPEDEGGKEGSEAGDEATTTATTTTSGSVSLGTSEMPISSDKGPVTPTGGTAS